MRELIIKYDDDGTRYAVGKANGEEEVVRCKDCKYYRSDGGTIMECEVYEVPIEDNHYCGYGEK